MVEAFGVARADPVGDILNRAVVAFRITEAFGHERTLAALGLPLRVALGSSGADMERGGAGLRMTGSGRTDLHHETNPVFLCSFA